MKREDIESDEYFEELVENRELTPKATDNYSTAIFKYCSLNDMTPTELIDEAVKDEEAGIRTPKRRLKKRLLRFKKYLREEGYEARYARALMTMVKSLYLEQEIEIPKVKMNKFTIEDKKDEDIPSREDIRKVLKHSNLMYRAIILLMASSGMGSAEVRKLKYQDFYDGIESYLGTYVNKPFDVPQLMKMVGKKSIIVTWELTRSKKNTPQYNCSSPETTTAIFDYLEKHPPTSMNDFLFRTRGTQIKDDTMVKNFQLINDRCGFPKVGSARYFHAHALRSFFASTALAHGMSKEYVDWGLGHTLNKTDKAYFKQEKEAALEQYKNVVEHLSISEVEKSYVELDNPEIVKLINSKDEEIASLRKSLNNLERKVDSKIDGRSFEEALKALGNTDYDLKLDLKTAQKFMKKNRLV